MAPVPELSQADLTHVLDHTRHVWDDYRDARIFITGVTGFVGSWLLETLVHADRTLHLGIKATVLVRDKDAFAARLPHLASSPIVRAHIGDVRIVDPPTHAFSHFVHCASAATPRMNAEKPDEVLDIIENGTERMIEEAATGSTVRFLQVSSGSVYGPQPDALDRIAETYTGTPDRNDPAQRFGAAKRKAEQVGVAVSKKGVGFVSARMFALVGPRLPLDGQFAIGNFFADALAGRTVDLNSDGTPVRSWMYAADMAAWCWTLLARGRAGVGYNVGSEEQVSLWDAAHRIAALPSPVVAVTRAKEPVAGALPQRYVPSVAMARDELNLEPWIPLDDALARTWSWLKH